MDTDVERVELTAAAAAAAAYYTTTQATTWHTDLDHGESTISLPLGCGGGVLGLNFGETQTTSLGTQTSDSWWVYHFITTWWWCFRLV